MNILSLESVRKRFGAGPVLEDVTFGLAQDERMGIIGRNGSGKTTLLRIIAGWEPPDGGRVVLAADRLVAYVPQNPEFDGGQTVLDAVFDQGHERIRRLHDYEQACRDLEAAGGHDERRLARVTELGHQLEIHGGWDLENNAKAVLHRLGLTVTTDRVATLSGGQRKRLALARGLILRPDLLILDEPTNHLDVETIGWLESYLARYTGALLLVTHDRTFLDRVATRMLEIEKGRVQRYEGNYAAFLEKKEEQAAQREAEAVSREGLIRRELAWLRQGAKARSTKQKAHVERARALLAAPKEETARTLELSARISRLGNQILELEGLTKAFGGRTLIRDFTLRLKRGDRIGLIGPNGSGKTTLLEIIAGRVPPDAGTVTVGQTVVIGYFDQESRVLEDDRRVIDHLSQVADHVETADGTVISASRMLERFLFTSAQAYSPIGKLSGGERRRLALLRLLMGSPNVLLLDEPTNDFDIATLLALEAYLESFAGCLIVASHDRSFLDRAVDSLFRFEEGGTLRGYPGNYTTFLEIQAREEAALAEAEAAAAAARPHGKGGPAGSSGRGGGAAGPGGDATAPGPEPGAKPGSGSVAAGLRKLTFKERRELEDLERAIAVDEARQAELEALLSVPSGDFQAVAPLTTELQNLLVRLERSMARWAELAARAEVD
ncbi:MAG: ABC-F family ATP-binding cassette domain-containing protein [Candidatus Riflebacteria bacterium]|nr:ABC-F family ATP-binding cassette domain-containing protein [Candidatus Riflebacteria bacterium]